MSNWPIVRLEEICEPVDKANPSEMPEKSFKYVDISAIDNNANRVTNGQTLLGKDAPSRARQLLKSGDVVFSTVRTYLKNIAPIPLELDGAVASTGFCVLRPGQDIDARYLLYYVLTDDFIARITPLQRGTSYPAVRDADVKGMLIPLPPREEQELLVEEIEKQFTRLDAAANSLLRAKANLRKYRASVLASITEPTQWKRLQLGDLVWDVGYGTSIKCDYAFDGPPVLRIPNVVRGKVDLSDLKYARSSDELEDSERLEPNDYLIVRTNGSKNLIGRAALVREPFMTTTHFASYLIRFRFSDASIAAWVSLVWDSPTVREQVLAGAATSAGQYNVNIKSLSKVRIPLPELAARAKLIVDAEERFSLLEELSKSVDANLKRASRLRQSVLDAAFSGTLLTNEPVGVNI